MKRSRPSCRVALILSAALIAGCTPQLDSESLGQPESAPATAPDFSAGTWVDLTHSFSSETIYWPTEAGFRLDTLSWGLTDGGYFYSSFELSAAEHGGTHLDAPVHFAMGGLAADEIPLNRLIGPAVVVDVSDVVTPDYLISVADLEAWEADHGTIPDGVILLLRTDWSQRWSDRAAYLGTEMTGPEAVPQLHFPGLDPVAALWLVENRAISAVGIDTPSIDFGQSTAFGVHVTLYAENIVGFENVAHLDALPPTGALVWALPMKIEGGSGGPLRIVAWVPYQDP